MPVPERGGSLRIVRASGAEWTGGGPCVAADPLPRIALGEPLVRLGPDGDPRPGAAVRWRIPPSPAAGSAIRWAFELDPNARFPDGSPVTARDVVDSWQSRLQAGCPDVGWLLSPVVGLRSFLAGETDEVSGLVARERELAVQLERQTPDLLTRLAHPALQLFPGGPTAGSPGGPGPFHPDPGSGRWVANPHFSRGRPYLDDLEPLPGADDDAALLLRIGEADLAVVHGRSADRLLEGAAAPLAGRRLPAWDRTYALWLRPDSRPLNDPALRRQIDTWIDRRSLVHYLFAGAARPVWSLIPDPGEPAGEQRDAPSPYRTTGNPRLSLLFDDGDPDARAIAARVRADLLPQGIRVVLDPAPTGEFRSRLEGGEQPLALIAHQPSTPDPALGLRETLSPLGADAAEAVDALDRACAVREPEMRRAAAALVESALRADGRLIPLVRLQAWLVTRDGLIGLHAESWTGLSLEKAGWLR